MWSVLSSSRDLRAAPWALLLLLLAAGCGEEPSLPVPVPVELRRATPPPAAGAVWHDRTWDEARFRELTGYLRDPEDETGRLRNRSSEAITRAKSNPEALWSVLTDPATPYADRGAVAFQAKSTFPVSWVPRLMAALGALRADEAEHNWGLRPNPDHAVFTGREKWWHDVQRRLVTMPERARARTVLGHPWRVPDSATEWYPQERHLREMERAPWPVQVKVALETLLREAAPKMSVQGETVPQCEAWLEAALEMPWGDDEQALLFVEAAQAVTHHVSEGVLARYRAIVADARFPSSARRVLGRLGEISRLAMFAPPDTVPDFQVILLDALAGPHAQPVRDLAAYAVPGLRQQWEDGGARRDANQPKRRAEPATLILLASRLGLDPDQGSAWHRLYVYLFSVCEALDGPPFAPDRRMRPEDADPRIDAFHAWFRLHGQDFERRAAEERPALEAARARLVALAGR